jgi:hypothetical protein
MSGAWKRSYGWATKAPPDERGGNRHARPNATAPHFDSTDPRHSIARDQRPLRVTPKSARDIPWSADGAAQHDGGFAGSTPLSRFVESAVRCATGRLRLGWNFRSLNNVWRTPSAATRPLLHLDAGTKTTRVRVVGVICLRRDRRQRGRSSQGQGVILVASSPRIWKPRAVGDQRGASARLRQLLRCGVMTPVLTNGEATENMASAAGKALI